MLLTHPDTRFIYQNLKSKTLPVLYHTIRSNLSFLNGLEKPADRRILTACLGIILFQKRFNLHTAKEENGDDEDNENENDSGDSNSDDENTIPSLYTSFHFMGKALLSLSIDKSDDGHSLRSKCESFPFADFASVSATSLGYQDDKYVRDYIKIHPDSPNQLKELLKQLEEEAGIVDLNTTITKLE